MQRTLVLVIMLLAVSQVPASSQVVARQGTPPPPKETHFASPMVLELPLPDVRSLDTDAARRLGEVREFICDNDVRILNLAIARQYTGPRKNRSLQLLVTGLISVGDSYDRRVDIALRLRSGEEAVATQTLRNVSAEEERVTPFRVVVPVDESALSAAYAAAHPATLEITLTVRDDS